MPVACFHECLLLFVLPGTSSPTATHLPQPSAPPSQVFDFGPLLAGRNKEGYLDGKHPEHTAQFRITNNGLFDLKASFWLKSTVKKEGELGLAETNEFIVRPATMGLKVDETQDLQASNGFKSC